MRKRNNKFVQLQRKIEGKPPPNLSKEFKVGDLVRVVNLDRSIEKLGAPSLRTGYIGRVDKVGKCIDGSVKVSLGLYQWVLAEECEYA